MEIFPCKQQQHSIGSNLFSDLLLNQKGDGRFAYRTGEWRSLSNRLVTPVAGKPSG